MVKHNDGAKESYDYCRDFSENGLFIETPFPGLVGETIELTFTLPLDSSKLQISARIMWVRTDQERSRPKGMGLNFEFESNEQREKIVQNLKYLDTNGE